MTPSKKPRPQSRKPSKAPSPVCFSEKNLEILNALVEHLVAVRAGVDVLLLKLHGTLEEQAECRRRVSDSLSVTEKDLITVSKQNYKLPYSNYWYRKTYLEVVNDMKKKKKKKTRKVRY
jgi:hypothetical protein